VIGSGIAAQRLSPGQPGLDLLENSTATAAAIVAIILSIGSVSGAHLNPMISLADRLLGGMSWREVGTYWSAQLSGAIGGAVIANLMFNLPAVQISTKVRSSPGLLLGEAVATFGLLFVVFGIVRSGRAAAVPFAVGGYLAGAYWFTSSTSFANPAVAVARMLSDTFAGIAPRSVGPFVAAQVVGGLLAVVTIRVLYPAIAEVAGSVLMPHPAPEEAEA